MKRLVSSSVLLSLLILFGFFASTKHAQALSVNDWKPGRIIDDAIFQNKNSMSVVQIQQFLDSKVPTCDTWGQVGGGSRTQYAASQGVSFPLTCLKEYSENPTTKENNLGRPTYVVPGGRSAAQLIWDAAQAQNINPQVLLVLLQKEQGLVADDWPFPVQFEKATGNNCPDHNVPCDTAYAGFWTQINNAGIQLNYYVNHFDQYNYAPGSNAILYNPDASCGTSNVFIENRYTAALYIYTPYQPNAGSLSYKLSGGRFYETSPPDCGAYGNLNFWKLFNDWFGSSTYPQPIGATLKYSITSGKIYLAIGSRKYFVPNWPTMTNYGLDRYVPIPSDDKDLSTFADGGILTNYFWNSKGVFMVNNTKKFHVTGTMCVAWNIPCADSAVVQSYDNYFTDIYLQDGGDLGDLALIGKVVYKIESGKKRPIADPTSFNDLAYNWGKIIPTNIANDRPFGDLIITRPRVISFPPDQKIFYYDGQSYHLIPDTGTLSSWGWSSGDIIKPPTSTFNTTLPNLQEPLSIWSQVGSKRYLLDSGKKYLLSVDQQKLWPNAIYQSFTSGTTDNRPLSTLFPYILSGTKVYLLDNGTKRHVQTYADYAALGVTPQMTTSISGYSSAGIQDGLPALGDGAVISIANDPKVYVVSNAGIRYIPDSVTFADFGFDQSKIRNMPANITDAYPIKEDLTNSGLVNGSPVLVYAKTALRPTPQQVVNFGIKTELFTNAYSNSVLKNTSSPPLTSFFYNVDDGRIYYGSGGDLHFVSNYSSFVAYGGLTTKVTTINSNTLKLFKVGVTI